MTILPRLFGGEDGCDHPNIVYEPGNCARDDVHLCEGQVVLATYRPYYRHCKKCGETFYETRHTADGDETPLGEPIARTSIPYHVTDDYLREHRRTAGEHQ